jgi:hypothetical protein
VERAQAPDQLGGVNAGDFAIGEEARQRV